MLIKIYFLYSLSSYSHSSYHLTSIQRPLSAFSHPFISYAGHLKLSLPQLPLQQLSFLYAHDSIFLGADSALCKTASPTHKAMLFYKSRVFQG